jgi:hypothetical protein
MAAARLSRLQKRILRWLAARSPADPWTDREQSSGAGADPPERYGSHQPQSPDSCVAGRAGRWPVGL